MPSSEVVPILFSDNPVSRCTQRPTTMFENIPQELPETGLDADHVYATFQQLISQYSADLGAPYAMAHMDPPTPEIAAKIVGLNAAYNQNLLHPDLSPLASKIEKRVIDWLLPYFGMSDGHFCAGSTIANLSAIWCAREYGSNKVVASKDAHISIAKAAHILGMDYTAIDVSPDGKINYNTISDLKNACLVLTAGTTGRGAIDKLSKTDALWTHVDAAWAGPLRLTKHAHLLNGIESADSVAISAHKWFYQPKDSAIVLFSSEKAQQKISYGSSYLATANVGVQGSRGAAALPLMATLIQWGRLGLATRIERNMAASEELAAFLSEHKACELKQFPETAVLNWKPIGKDIEDTLQTLAGVSSQTSIDGNTWVRQVAANPSADISVIMSKIDACLKA